MCGAVCFGRKVTNSSAPASMPRLGSHGDAGEAAHLSELVKNLKASLKSKDALIKHLKAVSAILDKAPQDEKALGTAKDELAGVLVAKGLLQHSDKDVRLYAAFCQAHLLRIFAPASPYGDETTQNVFGMLLWSIQRLQQSTAPTFELALSTLQVISQTKSYFLLLDLGREDLVLKWTKGLLECVTNGNVELVEEYVVEVVGTILEEGEVTNDMLELLLTFLIQPRSSDNPAGASVVRAVLRRAERHVKPALQTYLTRLIDHAVDVKSELRHQLYNIVYQLYQCTPQVLLPVIPHISGELQSDEESRRLDAVALLGRMFCLPGVGLAAEYADVLDEFVRRYHDQKVDVRLAMLKLTAALIASAKSQEVQKKVLDAAADRLQDFDDRVRCAAVRAVCEASAARPEAVPEAALEAVSVRLRDTKPAVRKAAAVSLLTAFRQRVQLQEQGPALNTGAGSSDVSHLDDEAGDSADEDPQPHMNGTYSLSAKQGRRPQQEQQDGQNYELCWIPSRIFLCAIADAELRQALQDATAKEGLLPVGLSAAASARWWAHISSSAQAREKEALLLLVKSKAKLQRDLLTLLELRRSMSSREDDEGREEVSAAMRKVAGVVAAQLPDAHKAEESLLKLLAVKDNKVIASLQAALAVGAAPEASSKARKDAMARLGSKSPLADFVNSTCTRALPSWLALQHVQGLLALVLGQQQEGHAQDPDMQEEARQGAANLLHGFSKHAPSLLAGSVPHLRQLVQAEDAGHCTLGAQLLAGAGHVLRSLRAANGSAGGRAGSPALNEQGAAGGVAVQAQDLLELLPILRQLAQEGPPKAAKAAVLAIGALFDESRVQQELGSLCDELAGHLTPRNTKHQHTPARLQALSSIGRLMPEAFSRHVQVLLQYVTEDYLHANLDAAPALVGASSPAAEQQGMWRSPARGILLKAQALKALARGFVTDRDKALVPVPSMRAVVDYVGVLESLVEPEGEHPCLAEAAPLDAAYMRLAAASALLRLARRHDVRIGISSYVALGLVVQDTVAEVRASFGAKVAKLMRFFQARRDSHQLAAKYAAMLPLAAVDPMRENKVAAAQVLREFVVKRRQLAQQIVMKATAEDAAGAGSTLQEEPEMLLPYLLHLLAHHPDFPKAEAEEDADVFDPFQVMLQLVLQPLLSPVAGYTEAGAMLPAILKFMRSIKRTEDAMEEEPCTIQLHTLCDIATELARTITAQLQAGTKGASADAAASRAGEYPGSVILPKTLFKLAEGIAKGGKPTSFLPPSFEVHLDPDPPMPLVAASKATTAAQGKAAGAKPRSRRRAAGSAEKAAGSKRGKAKQTGQTSADSWESESEEEGAGKRKRARKPTAAFEAKRRHVSKEQHSSDEEEPSSSMETDIPIPAAAGPSKLRVSAARDAAPAAKPSSPVQGRSKAAGKEARPSGRSIEQQTKLTTFTAADASSPGLRADGSTRRRTGAAHVRTPRASRRQHAKQQQQQQEEEEEEEEEGIMENHHGEEEQQVQDTPAVKRRRGAMQPTAAATKAATTPASPSGSADAQAAGAASPASPRGAAKAAGGKGKGGGSPAAAKRHAANDSNGAGEDKGGGLSKRARRNDTGKKKAAEAGTADDSPTDDAATKKDQRKGAPARKTTPGNAPLVPSKKTGPAVKAEPVRRGRSAGKA